MLVQLGPGLRPSELLGLKRERVHIPFNSRANISRPAFGCGFFNQNQTRTVCPDRSGETTSDVQTCETTACRNTFRW